MGSFKTNGPSFNPLEELADSWWNVRVRRLDRFIIKFGNDSQTVSFRRSPDVSSMGVDTVDRLFNVPATCWCVSGTDLLGQLYMLSL